MTDPMRRAYSVLDVKAVSEADGFVNIEGIASTPTTDRMGDVVEPMGAKFKTPMPLLWQHRHAEPVGHVTFAAPTKKGIPFKARLPLIAEAGKLKDRVDEAIHSLKYELVSAVSIGFQAVEGAVERIDTGLRFSQWEWLELSLVTIPANSDAVITAIKSVDQQHLPASGTGGAADDNTPPGDSGIPKAAKRGSVLLKKQAPERKPQTIKIITPRNPK